MFSPVMTGLSFVVIYAVMVRLTYRASAAYIKSADKWDYDSNDLCSVIAGLWPVGITVIAIYFLCIKPAIKAMSGVEEFIVNLAKKLGKHMKEND